MLKAILKKEFIQVEISDTGIGIKSEELLNIFDRFRQIDDSRTRKYNNNLLESIITNNSQKKEYVHQNNRMLLGSFITEVLFSFFFY